MTWNLDQEDNIKIYASIIDCYPYNVDQTWCNNNNSQKIYKIQKIINIFVIYGRNDMILSVGTLLLLYKYDNTRISLSQIFTGRLSSSIIVYPKVYRQIRQLKMGYYYYP